MITIWSSQNDLKQNFMNAYLETNQKSLYLHYRDEYSLKCLLKKDNMWKENSWIFIDYIERDFHFTQIEKNIKYICEKSIEFNTNLYISTQSLDVLKYFSIFGKKDTDTFKKIDSIEKITVLSVELLKIALENNFEIR